MCIARHGVGAPTKALTLHGRPNCPSPLCLGGGSEAPTQALIFDASATSLLHRFKEETAGGWSHGPPFGHAPLFPKQRKLEQLQWPAGYGSAELQGQPIPLGEPILASLVFKSSGSC